MATRVLLTVDTELAWRHDARGADWRENLSLSDNPAGVGVARHVVPLVVDAVDRRHTDDSKHRERLRGHAGRSDDG